MYYADLAPEDLVRMHQENYEYHECPRCGEECSCDRGQEDERNCDHGCEDAYDDVGD